MPRSPLFPGWSLFPESIEVFRNLLQHPDAPGNVELISALLDLHAGPHQPLPEPLRPLPFDQLSLGFSSWQFNTLDSDFPAERLSPIRLHFRLEIHNRILQHAAAAGFLPVPPLPPPPPRPVPTHVPPTADPASAQPARGEG